MISVKVLGTAAVTLLIMIGALFYSLDNVTEQRDAAREEAAQFEQALELKKQEANLRAAESERLQKALEFRRTQTERYEVLTSDIKGEIHALRNDCTFSADASRLLREIYDRAVRQQAGEPSRPVPSSTNGDSNAAERSTKRD